LKKLAVSLLLAAVAAVALASLAFAEGRESEFEARLTQQNDPNATGEAEQKVEGRQIETRIKSEGLAPDLPHLQHIHAKPEGVSTCPTLQADTDGDGLVTVQEGVPFYGPVRVSLTTRGDTSAASGGALDRFPVADDKGRIDYSREFRVPPEVAEHLGDFAIVQHGVDLNGNGMYDNALEVSLPADCGPINRER
jgi:glucose/arabinose dehydrogenase